MKRRTQILLAACVVVAAAFQRTISFWTANVWDLSSPTKVLFVGLVVASAGLALLTLLCMIGVKPLAAGLAIGGILIILSTWHSHVGSTALLLLCLVIVLPWLGQRRESPTLLVVLSAAFLAAFGVVPVLQLIVEHAQKRVPYPIVELPAWEPATAAPDVEDVVFVIVDSYPNLKIAKSWFGHDPVALLEDLKSRGFRVPESSWSRHTFTVLSVSSILELTSIIEEGPTQAWGNRSSLWHILRGDNLVAQTLRSAGFEYTHVESGWDGTSCGPVVDDCAQGPWLDEQLARLFEPTIAHDWLETREFTVTGTFNAATALKQSLPSLLGNGSHDYVFAHLLLPHTPLLVDASCDLRDDLVRTSLDWATRAVRTSDQMGCVDRLLSSIIGSVDDDTAMLITGDHGTATGSQLDDPPSDWSDADIAERFGVFMAYRLPSVCAPPSEPDPIVAMGAILSCTLGESFITDPPRYLIGYQDPELVAQARMERIQAQVAAGTLPPENG